MAALPTFHPCDPPTMSEPDSSAAGQEPPAFDKAANRGFAHFVNAARFSWQGLSAAVRHEAAFRQELALAALLLPASFWIAADLWQGAILFASVMWVLVVELLNSALEAVVDRAGLEFHPLAKRAKDMGSAAVLLSLLGAGALWMALLWQNLIAA